VGELHLGDLAQDAAVVARPIAPCAAPAVQRDPRDADPRQRRARGCRIDWRAGPPPPRWRIGEVRLARPACSMSDRRNQVRELADGEFPRAVCARAGGKRRDPRGSTRRRAAASTPSGGALEAGQTRAGPLTIDAPPVSAATGWDERRGRRHGRAA
jgi:hypothetical protein